MVFQILGVNLLEVIKRYDYKGVPMPLVRILAK
jgi:serine/threonine-protein kinase SRPK3